MLVRDRNLEEPHFKKLHNITEGTTKYMALLIKIKESMYDLNFLEDITLITFFALLASFITPLIISLNSI